MEKQIEEILSKYRKGIEWLCDESLYPVPKSEDVLTHAQAKEELLTAVKAYTEYVLGLDEDLEKGLEGYNKMVGLRNALRIEQRQRAEKAL